MRFAKYHALGNDYLVLDPALWQRLPTPAAIRRICHRHYGIGSDGILWGPVATAEGVFGLRIFNPDGSEAEKSGNGLRIFARYLWDLGRADAEWIHIDTAGGRVRAQVAGDGGNVTVEMGRVSFASADIPVTGPDREVLNEVLTVADQSITFSAATVGNPHCVVLRDKVDEDLARRLGPLLETNDRFPNRTNVQFVEVIDESTVRIEIWERGAGYTLASGSSSTAAAAVAHRLGLCAAEVSVQMPGGEINITFDAGFAATMTGPVTRVAEGELDPALVHQDRT